MAKKESVPSAAAIIDDVEDQRERERECAFEALFACACLLQGNFPKDDRSDTLDPDVIFLPGLAVDNWQEDHVDAGILQTARDVWLVTKAVVAIPGNAGTRPQGVAGPISPMGYPGGAAWLAGLTRLWLPEEDIVFYAASDVGPDGQSWNTRTEIDDFVRLARDRGWTSAVVVTTPFHTLRVLLTLVQALKDAGYRMRLRSVTPRSVSWSKRVYHSQGMQQLPRYTHILEEWARIPRYQANGSICAFRDLCDFLVAQWEADGQPGGGAP